MTTLPHTDSVECELHQGWLTVWFNQPERRNPLTDEVVADLQRICDALQDDRSVRGLTLRGRGGFFCAGGDLKGFKTMATASNDEVIAMSETIGRLLYTLDRLPMVTIAVIEGAAMAGGSVSLAVAMSRSALRMPSSLSPRRGSVSRPPRLPVM